MGGAMLWVNGGELTLTPSRFISENPIVSKIMYWLRITFVFILILFIDSVNRVYRVQLEVLAASDQSSKGAYVQPQH
jgi:hypothetical protein